MGLYGGQVKDEIIKSFSNIGYNVSYQILNAAAYGVPQTRKRVFFVGVKKECGVFVFPEPLLSEGKYVSSGDAIGDLPGLENTTGEDPAVYPKTSGFSLSRTDSNLTVRITIFTGLLVMPFLR